MNPSIKNIFNTKRQVGIVFHDHAIRFAALNHKGLQDCCFEEISLEEGLIEAGKIKQREKCIAVLKKTARKLKIIGGEVVFAVPDSSVILRSVDVPGNRNDDELRSYFVSELGSKIQLPFEAPVFDFYAIERTALITKVILFVAPEFLVKEYVSLLQDCGLKPAKADLSLFALERCFHSLDLPERESHRMYIQLDNTSMNVSVFSGEIPLFTRYIALQSSDQSEEGLYKASSEINRILNFYQFTVQKGGASVTSISLIGDHPFIETYHESIESVVGVALDPLYKQTLLNTEEQPVPAKYFTALGLALKPR